MGVIAAVAEFERDLLIERTHSGLSRAKAEGKALGRPSALSASQIAEVRRRLSGGRSSRSYRESVEDEPSNHHASPCVVGEQRLNTPLGLSALL